MPSQLPTTDTTNRAVKDFGIGTYDSPVQSEYIEEDDLEVRNSLPGFPYPKEEGDEVIGDGYCPTSDIRKVKSSSTLSLPGDFDRAPKRKRSPEESVIQAPIESAAATELPRERENPPAHSDYYDKSKTGSTALPGTAKNEETLDKFLGSLGNWWSGLEFDDLAQPISFPSTDSPQEKVDKFTSVPIGAASERKPKAMNKQATNLDLVGTIASDFLKKNGKNDLTRRHVMAFLQENGYHQYLASDVVRCLQQRHHVCISDVLDQFPSTKAKKKTAAQILSDANTMRHLVEIASGIASMRSGSRIASEKLRKCRDGIMDVIADLARGLQDG